MSHRFLSLMMTMVEEQIKLGGYKQKSLQNPSVHLFRICQRREYNKNQHDKVAFQVPDYQLSVDRTTHPCSVNIRN